MYIYFIISLIVCIFSIAYSYSVAGKKGYNPVLFGVLAFFGGIIVVAIVSIIPSQNGNFDDVESQEELDDTPDDYNGFMPYKNK